MRELHGLTSRLYWALVGACLMRLVECHQDEILLAPPPTPRHRPDRCPEPDAPVVLTDQEIP